MVHLKVYDGQEKVEVLELKEEIIHVGRDPGCELKLPDPSVSRHHAQIEPKGNFYLIRDYGSTHWWIRTRPAGRLCPCHCPNLWRVG